jgi:regulator of protease activity HflC (stomatin/prohibitin superfamily)
MNIASLIQGVASVSWLAVVGVLALLIVRASRQQGTKGFGSLLIGILVLAILMTTVGAGLVFLQPEERGVVISAFAPKGYREQALQPGLRWVIPFAETVVKYPISKQTYTMSIAPSEGQVFGDDSVTARTQDGQEIFVDASVIFAVNPANVIEIHIAWQNRYDVDLVRPVSRGIIRDAVSQYRVDEVISSKRFDMTQQIRDNLEKKLADNGLILIDFVLRNITFSDEYANSVEQKQIAEQQALQAKFVVESKKQEAEQARQVAQGKADAAVIASKGDAEARLIQADAEAKALKLIADVIKNNPEILQYQYITQLSPNIQVMLLPNNAPFILPLPNTNSPLATPQ